MSITVASQRNSAGQSVWLAKELGYFEDNGLDVTLKYFDTGAAMTAAGVSGDWHGGWLGAPPALVGSQKWGLITSGIQFAENENQVMLVRKDDLEGKTPKELVTGGKILVVTNSTSQQVLFGCLDYLGVAASDVQMVPLDPSSIVQSFQAGQADVAMTWADVDFPLLRDPSYVKICNGDQAGVDVYCVYAVTPDFWSNHPEQAAAYVDAVYRAAEYMNDHPDKAADYLVDFYKTIGTDHGLEDAKLALSLRQWYTLDDAIDAFESGDAEEGLKATAAYFVDAGVWEDSPDVSKAADSGLELLKAAKQYREKMGR